MSIAVNSDYFAKHRLCIGYAVETELLTLILNKSLLQGVKTYNVYSKHFFFCAVSV
jgi:hypothetical protein